MIPIPNYIKQYAIEKKQKRNKLYLSLKCDCGCEKFYILKNSYTVEEKRQIKEYEANVPKTGWHTIYGELDTNGEFYNYIKILGLFKKRVIFPKPPVCTLVKVIKAKCKDCKKEILVFDNRFFGYDGTTSKNIEEREYKPHLNMINENSYNIEIIIVNESSLDEFNNVIGEKCTFEFYSNSFSWIKINKKDENGKKTLVEDIETA